MTSRRDLRWLRPGDEQSGVLIVIDVQQGFDDPGWGRRDNHGKLSTALGIHGLTAAPLVAAGLVLALR